MKRTLSQAITVKRSEAEPEALELVAAAILSVEQGFKKLLNAGASEALIVLLLHDMTKVGKPDIRAILKAAPRIAEVWLSKKTRS